MGRLPIGKTVEYENVDRALLCHRSVHADRDTRVPRPKPATRHSARVSYILPPRDIPRNRPGLFEGVWPSRWSVGALTYREVSIYSRTVTTDQQIEVLKALNNETRLKILGWLKEPARQFGRQEVGDFQEDGVCVSLIQKKSGLSQSTVSSYLALLTRAGLVKAKRVGQWTYYRRNEDAIRRFVDGLAATLK